MGWHIAAWFQSSATPEVSFKNLSSFGDNEKSPLILAEVVTQEGMASVPWWMLREEMTKAETIGKQMT